ncbi:MAG: hypothetical protein K0S47_235 [Herbinix sp.]|jgi:hypothetical protein|nr:hypothetical protein [Herbinix sp.]
MTIKNFNLAKDQSRKNFKLEKTPSRGKEQSSDKGIAPTIIFDVRANANRNMQNDQELFQPQFSQRRLQEAVIWSEILGKPVSKRKKRYPYGN